MNKLNFTFRITPEVKDRPRFSIQRGRAHVRTSAKTRKFENTIAVMARSQMIGKQKLEGMIEAKVYFQFKRPKKTTLKTPRKDLDNLCKSIFDSLNGIAFNDDTQIYIIYAVKTWGESDEIALSLVSAE